MTQFFSLALIRLHTETYNSCSAETIVYFFLSDFWVGISSLYVSM